MTVDRQKAIAVGVMVNLESGEVALVDRVVDDGEGRCPSEKIKALWRSVEKDWPGYQLAIVQNDAAAELQRQEQLWKLGLSGETDVMPARIEAHNRAIKDRS